MTGDVSIKEKLEYLKNHIYNELNRLKTEMNTEESRKQIAPVTLKASKHRKAYRRERLTYKKYIAH